MTDVIDALQGLDIGQYIFIKCPLCRNIYRWGRRGGWYAQCPYCGQMVYNTYSYEVDKQEYYAWLQQMGTTENINNLQRNLWNPRISNNPS